MGSTYSAKQTAYAARANDGQVFYFLEESTFESNVFPQRPHASLTFVGTGPSCMSRMIVHSGACEGGMLKGASGCIKPESYVQKWRSALKAAVEIDTTKVFLEFIFGDGIYKIPVEQRPKVEAWLLSAGVQPVSVAIDNKDGFSVRLDHVAHMLGEFGNMGVLVWRVVGPAALTLASTGKNLGYTVPAFKAGRCDQGVAILKVPKPDDEAHDNRFFLILRSDGHYLDYRFSALDSLISNEVVKAELAFPGSAIHMIGHYREAMANAPVVDGDMLVTVTRSQEGENANWKRKCYDKLAASLNVIGTTFTVKMKTILCSGERLRQLSYVGSSNVKFVESHSLGVQASQSDLDLLAA